MNLVADNCSRKRFSSDYVCKMNNRTNIRHAQITLSLILICFHSDIPTILIEFQNYKYK